MSMLRLPSATVVAILAMSSAHLFAGEADGLRLLNSAEEHLASGRASCGIASETAVRRDGSYDRPQTTVAQATLCCCTGFDGRTCCNYVERCETPPLVPGCYCQ